MTSHPPRSTLFPYTTLFRSQVRRPSRARSGQRGGLERRSRIRRDGRNVGAPRGLHGAEGAGRAGALPRDRKSTRLNSSHLGISYAVFCLKKKKRSLIRSEL